MIRLIRLLPLAAAATVLTACGPDAPPPPQVASLSTPDSTGATPAPSSGATAGADRPQLRLDSSEEDVRRAWAPYNLCLKQHGHKMYAGRGDGNSPDQNDHSPTAQAARSACAGKLPVQPPELNQQNPEYADNYRAYLKCMDTKGLKVVPIEPFGTGWTYAEDAGPLSPQQRTQVERDCKIEAFSAQR